MDIRPIDSYFLEKQEPVRECMLFLRSYILSFNERLTEEWKYGMPFYCFQGKMLCYLWTNKKTGQPYIGIVDGNKMHYPELVQEKRSRMKILRIDTAREVPLGLINDILQYAISIRNG